MISDKAYHKVTMSISEDARDMVPPINAIKDDRNWQNKIMDIRQITEVRHFLLNFMTWDYIVSGRKPHCGIPGLQSEITPKKGKKGPFLFQGCRFSILEAIQGLEISTDMVLNAANGYIVRRMSF